MLPTASTNRFPYQRYQNIYFYTQFSTKVHYLNFQRHRGQWGLSALLRAVKLLQRSAPALGWSSIKTPIIMGLKIQQSSLSNDKKLFYNPPSSAGVAACIKGNRYFGNRTNTDDTTTLHDTEVSAKHAVPLLFPWKCIYLGKYLFLLKIFNYSELTFLPQLCCCVSFRTHLQKIVTGHCWRTGITLNWPAMLCYPNNFPKWLSFAFRITMGLGNAERCRQKKRFSERNSRALRITHFLNPDKGFLKLAQRPHSDTSFLRVGINLLLPPRTGSLRKGRKHTQRQPVCHTTNITLV